jgi:hypothetical protein
MNLAQALINSNYVFDTDIAIIEKSATGKVIFYKAVGEPILAVGEQMDVYIDTSTGALFIVINRNFIYRFTFWSLTKIGSEVYTAIGQDQVNIPAYQTKFKEVYDYLNENVFVGCCECGGGGSSDIVWLNTIEDRPATGVVDKLYIVKSPFSVYIWNGTGYDSLGGGGGVSSVVAGTDIVVNATDPANPIVGVVPHTFVRLSGTETGFPMLGNIQWIDAVDEIPRDIINQPNSGTGGFNALRFDYNSLELEHNSGDDSTRITLGNQGITITGSKPDFLGQVYSADYSLNFILRSLIDLAVLKSRLWNGSSNPTVTNDSAEGFVAGRSLWLNTTTGVLWKCEDASTGAAVWEVYYDPRKFTKLVSVVDSTAVTGTTANTALRWVTIPAGTFEAGDIISVTSRIRKTGANGTAIQRFYQNTSQSLTGANILGTYNLTPAGVLYQQLNRDIVIKSATVTEVVPPSANIPLDETMVTGAATQYNIDWLIEQHIGFYVQLTSGSDSVVQSYYSIEKITNIP